MKSLTFILIFFLSCIQLGSQTVEGQIHIKANSSVGLGTLSHLLLEEPEEEFARIRMINTVESSFWDIAGLCKPNNSDAALNFYYDGPSTEGINILSLIGNGNAVLTGDLTELSDIRLKRGLKPLTNVSSSLSQIIGYRYHWKDTNLDQNEKIGLIAQEVELFFPELVIQNSDGIKSVNYTDFIPIIITALKEKDKEILELKSEINNLSDRILKIENLD